MLNSTTIRNGLAAMVFGAMPVVGSAAQSIDLPASCRASIDSAVPGWQLSLPPADLAAHAKQKNLVTNLVRADVDNDDKADAAALVRGTGSRAGTYIAVCLAAGARRFHLIAKPYCSDGIAVAPKGTVAHDFGTGKRVTYRSNGIHAYCFEKAGGTYLYENGRFRLVVDSD